MKNNLVIIAIVLVVIFIGYMVYAMWYNKKQKAFLDSVTNAEVQVVATDGSGVIETRPALVTGTGNEDMASGDVDAELYVPIIDVNQMMI